jgi:hypothetical protein
MVKFIITHFKCEGENKYDLPVWITANYFCGNSVLICVFCGEQHSFKIAVKLKIVVETEYLTTENTDLHRLLTDLKNAA